MTHTARRLAAALPVAVVLLGAGCSSDSPTAPRPAPTPTPTPVPIARYRVTFTATWSAASHPRDFPPNPHFSPLVGATHAADTRFWRDGGPASRGIEDMAELGSTSPLDDEVRAAITAGRAERLLLGQGIGRSPGETSLDFEVGVGQPFVTLVSMVAPSPDWFVGVSALPLLEDGAWRDRVEVDLLPWDAGTDGGPTYAAPDQEARPHRPVSRLTGPPVESGAAVAAFGRFVFTRL